VRSVDFDRSIGRAILACILSKASKPKTSKKEAGEHPHNPPSHQQITSIRHGRRQRLKVISGSHPLVGPFASELSMGISPFESPSKILIAATSAMLLIGTASPQDAVKTDTRHFDYSEAAPLGISDVSVQQRDGVSVHDIKFVSPNGGNVPAYLVLPKGSGTYAAILWGHWLMPNSSVSNREEFLNEAIAIAPAGVISLLIDAPQARPGFKPSPNPVLIAQQVIDLRRGIDLLRARPDVDSKRIAYVGHSWDAGTGAILDAVDKRIAAFVFMGGPQSNIEYVLSSDSPRMVSARQGKDMTKVEQAMRTNAWADPGSYAAQLGPAPALFQYGLQDEEWVPLKDAKDYVALSTGPKEVKFYDSGHAFNEQARLDRFKFLQQHLTLTSPQPGVLENVPNTK
jgi:cephalosporin-C deacetylase-like acetyl esterase